MEKTIKEWLNELEEPYRTQALDNYDNLVEKSRSLGDALVLGFSWADSPEGLSHWTKVYESVIRAKTNS